MSPIPGDIQHREYTEKAPGIHLTAGDWLQISYKRLTIYRMQKRWSKTNDACAGCGKVSGPHHAIGLCRSCYNRKYTEKNSEYLKTKRAVNARRYRRSKRKEEILREALKENLKISPCNTV